MGCTTSRWFRCGRYAGRRPPSWCDPTATWPGPPTSGTPVRWTAPCGSGAVPPWWPAPECDGRGPAPSRRRTRRGPARRPAGGGRARRGGGSVLAVDAADHGHDLVRRRVLGEVRLAHHTDQPVPVDHRQPLDLVLRHGPRELLQVVVRADRHDLALT